MKEQKEISSTKSEVESVLAMESRREKIASHTDTEVERMTPSRLETLP